MIYRSPEPDIEIPDVTLSAHVVGGAAARGDHPAFIDGASGGVTTYAELAARVDAVAALLQSKGIVKGSVVGLVGPNSAEWARNPRRPRSIPRTSPSCPTRAGPPG